MSARPRANPWFRDEATLARPSRGVWWADGEWTQRKATNLPKRKPARAPMTAAEADRRRWWERRARAIALIGAYEGYPLLYPWRWMRVPQHGEADSALAGRAISVTRRLLVKLGVLPAPWYRRAWAWFWLRYWWLF